MLQQLLYVFFCSFRNAELKNKKVASSPSLRSEETEIRVELLFPRHPKFQVINSQLAMSLFSHHSVALYLPPLARVSVNYPMN